VSLMLDNISLVMGRRNCPNCGDPIPMVRVPQNGRQFLAGGSTCPKCGAESDRNGNIRNPPENRG
jgi:uncharacterized protein (UPF0212 family)